MIACLWKIVKGARGRPFGARAGLPSGPVHRVRPRFLTCLRRRFQMPQKPQHGGHGLFDRIGVLRCKPIVADAPQDVML